MGRPWLAGFEAHDAASVLRREHDPDVAALEVVLVEVDAATPLQGAL
jgi:hypothetical protein